MASGSTLSEGELREMIASYYQARGWSPLGAVPAGKIAELGLDGLLAGGSLT